jgi:hypothetical protein
MTSTEFRAANASDGDRRPLASDDGPGIDPVEFVRRNRWLLIAGLLAGTAIGIGLTFVVMPKWEANFIVRLGTIPQWSNKSVTTVPIESSTGVVLRLGQASFKDQVLIRLGLPASHADPVARMFRDSLRPRVLDKPDLVMVRVWGPSKAATERLAGGIVDELSAAHLRDARPTYDRFARFLTSTQEDLKHAESERARLVEAAMARANARTPSGAAHERSAPAIARLRYAEDVVSSNALATHDRAIHALREREFALREVVSPERSYPTALLEPVWVDEERVYPKRSVFALVGAGLGLVVAAALAVVFRRL